MKKNFNDFKIGDSAEISHIITDDDIKKFANLTGDYNPLHLDEDFAQRTNFKGRVVHGMLTASFISTIIGQKLPGPGALWCEQSLKFILPVRIGEKIKILVKIIQLSPAQKLFVLATDIYNHKNQQVITGESTVKFVEQEEFMVKKSDNKSAIIITGATGGIGAASALALANIGYPIVVSYLNNADKAEKLVNAIQFAEGHAVAIRANVTVYEEVELLFREASKLFKSIHGYIHAASAPIIDKSFDELIWDDLQAHLEIQLKGGFNLAKASLPYLLSERNGSIVNIISTVTAGVPPDKWSAYVIAKASLLSLTRNLSAEYGPKGIRVNAVSPGMTLTDMTGNLSERTKLIEKMRTPLRRLAINEDIAEVIKFLMTDSARHITGENIAVCGGSIMK